MKKFLLILILLSSIAGSAFAQQPDTFDESGSGTTGTTSTTGGADTFDETGSAGTTTNGPLTEEQKLARCRAIQSSGNTVTSDWLTYNCRQRILSGSNTGQTIKRDCATIAAGTDLYFANGCYATQANPQAWCETLAKSHPYYKVLNCVDYKSIEGSAGFFGGSPSTTAQNNGATVVGAQSGSAEAQQCSKIKFLSLLDILVWAKCIIAVLVVPLLFVLAFVFFLVNVLRFMTVTEDKKKKEAKQMIWWGLVALFVMVSVWGIIRIAANILGVDSGVVPILQTSKQ